MGCKAELHRSVFAVRFLETDPRFFRTRRSPVRFGVRFDRFETDAFRVTDFLAIISVTVLPSVLNGEPVIKTLGPTLAIKGEGYSRTRTRDHQANGVSLTVSGLDRRRAHPKSGRKLYPFFKTDRSETDR